MIINGTPQSREVAFLANTEGFMTEAVVANLEDNDFEVSLMKPRFKEYNSHSEQAGIYLLYLDSEKGNGFESALNTLKSRCMSDPGTHIIYLIGTPAEIYDAKSILTDEFVSDVFERPINVKELVEKLNNDLKRQRYAIKKKHILVVDDDPNYLNSLNTWLSGKYQVYMADSGLNAISLLARHEIDLILMDYEMPIVSGAKILEMLRSNSETKNIPVMFLTSKADKYHVMTVMRFRPVKYLLKSLKPGELVAEVDGFFAS